MIDLLEFIIYLFFLTPTFIAFYMMFSCLFVDRDNWGNLGDKQESPKYRKPLRSGGFLCNPIIP